MAFEYWIKLIAVWLGRPAAATEVCHSPNAAAESYSNNRKQDADQRVYHIPTIVTLTEMWGGSRPGTGMHWILNRKFTIGFHYGDLLVRISAASPSGVTSALMQYVIARVTMPLC